MQQPLDELLMLLTTTMWLAPNARKLAKATACSTSRLPRICNCGGRACAHKDASDRSVSNKHCALATTATQPKDKLISLWPQPEISLQAVP